MKKCKRCGNEFTPKNPKGKFCSDKCRVYWNRGKIKFVSTTPESYDGEKMKPNIIDEPLQWLEPTPKQEINAKIIYYETEKAKLGTGSLANSMRYFYDKKIAELRKQLK